MGSSKKCEKSWKIYSVSKKWTLTMEKSSKSDVYQKKKKKCFKESQNFGRASRVSPKLRKIKDVEGLMFPFIYRVILRYSRSTENGVLSSYIHDGVHLLNSWWGSSWMWEKGTSFLHISEVPKNFLYL